MCKADGPRARAEHATLASRQVVLPSGVPAQHLVFAREDGRRLAFAVWLDADGRPSAASLPAAWRAAVLRGVLRQPTGGTLVICWTDELQEDDPGRVAREAARVARLLDGLGVRSVRSTP